MHCQQQTVTAPKLRISTARTGLHKGELMHWYAGRGASEEDAEISKRLRLTGYAA